MIEYNHANASNIFINGQEKMFRAAKLTKKIAWTVWLLRLHVLHTKTLECSDEFTLTIEGLGKSCPNPHDLSWSMKIHVANPHVKICTCSNFSGIVDWLSSEVMTFIRKMCSKGLVCFCPISSWMNTNVIKAKPTIKHNQVICFV